MSVPVKKAIRAFQQSHRVQHEVVIAASQAGKYKTLCQCIGLAMLMLPMWSLADGMNTTPLWMTVYYTITYALIYLALILCLYSGGEYLVNTFGGRKKTAKSEKETK